MDFKQSTIGEILDSEREMVIRGASRYGPYFVNAEEFTGLLSSGMVKSVDGDRFLFALFLGHVKKHLTLALFSAVRLHHVQAMMNLRQVLEAGACAAYAIAHTDSRDFADVKEDGTLDPSQKLTKKRYDWLDKNFPEGSAGIKRLKLAINEYGVHANVVEAHSNFHADFNKGMFNSPFFDYEDKDLVKIDLWLIANVAMGLSDLLYGVNKKLGVVKFQNGWQEKFRALAKENDRLKAEMMANKRFKKFNK